MASHHVVKLLLISTSSCVAVMALSYSVLYFVAGTKVEGILRQSADVEEVERRVQDYEQGSFLPNSIPSEFMFSYICWSDIYTFFKPGGIYFSGNNEFDPNEDAHVVGDCVKVLLNFFIDLTI